MNQKKDEPQLRNNFLQEGLQDFRAKMFWGPGRVRGGEGLLCLTSTPACFRRSVVVECRGLNTTAFIDVFVQWYTT